MPILFNTLLTGAGLDLSQVRLLRHADHSSSKGRTPYELWRDDRDAFDLYQSIQDFRVRPMLASARYWASFGSSFTGDTLFLGIYKAQLKGVLDRDRVKPHADGIDRAGSVDEYLLKPAEVLQDCAGRLLIDWGAGTRAWIQRASKQNKPILELRRDARDPNFPGYTEFLCPLSRLEALPAGWRDALSASRGVYLLTCPRTKEQYVGQAGGEHGFWGRWLSYVSNHHGGNEGMKSREASDYQVSILEVAGSAAGKHDLDRMETRWKLKLQSREMGLNRN